MNVSQHSGSYLDRYTLEGVLGSQDVVLGQVSPAQPRPQNPDGERARQSAACLTALLRERDRERERQGERA